MTLGFVRDHTTATIGLKRSTHYTRKGEPTMLQTTLTTTVKKIHRAQLRHRDIVEALRGLDKSMSDMPDTASITVTVPSGGGWSGEDLSF